MRETLARNKLYSVPDLRDRGWTATAIKKFLPAEPDDYRDNPRYSRAGAPMKFWLRSRVHRAEKSKSFLAWRVGAKAREEAAARAVTTRSLNMIENMRRAEVQIKRDLTTAQIEELARETHGGNYAGEPSPYYWCNRTARNCIRHNLTNYEALWALCNRGDTGQAAYDVLRDRVDALIDEVYPQFAGPDDDMPLDDESCRSQSGNSVAADPSRDLGDLRDEGGLVAGAGGGERKHPRQEEVEP